jgi:hypothetical protein
VWNNTLLLTNTLPHLQYSFCSIIKILSRNRTSTWALSHGTLADIKHRFTHYKQNGSFTVTTDMVITRKCSVTLSYSTWIHETVYGNFLHYSTEDLFLSVSLLLKRCCLFCQRQSCCTSIIAIRLPSVLHYHTSFKRING